MKNDFPSKARRADASERAYFSRVAAASRALGDEQPPRSLQETLERMATATVVAKQLGAQTNVDDDGDLASHIAFLEHIAEVTARKRSSTRASANVASTHPPDRARENGVG